MLQSCRGRWGKAHTLWIQLHAHVNTQGYQASLENLFLLLYWRLSCVWAAKFLQWRQTFQCFRFILQLTGHKNNQRGGGLKSQNYSHWKFLHSVEDKALNSPFANKSFSLIGFSLLSSEVLDPEKMERDYGGWPLQMSLSPAAFNTLVLFTSQLRVCCSSETLSSVFPPFLLPPPLHQTHVTPRLKTNSCRMKICPLSLLFPSLSQREKSPFSLRLSSFPVERFRKRSSNYL